VQRSRFTMIISEVTEFAGHTQVYDTQGRETGCKGGVGSNIIALYGRSASRSRRVQDPTGMHLFVDQAVVWMRRTPPGLKRAKAHLARCPPC
jgi:hypothetical protein